MERRQAEQIRALERGCFLGLGPSISRRPVAIHIGATRTSVRGGVHSLLPLPEAEPRDMQSLLFASLETTTPPRRGQPHPAPVAAGESPAQIAGSDAPLPEDRDPPHRAHALTGPATPPMHKTGRTHG